MTVPVTIKYWKMSVEFEVRKRWMIYKVWRPVARLCHQKRYHITALYDWVDSKWSYSKIVVILPYDPSKRVLTASPFSLSRRWSEGTRAWALTHIIPQPTPPPDIHVAHFHPTWLNTRKSWKAGFIPQMKSNLKHMCPAWSSTKKCTTNPSATRQVFGARSPRSFTGKSRPRSKTSWIVILTFAKDRSALSGWRGLRQTSATTSWIGM